MLLPLEPLSVEPLRLTLAALEWLTERRHLKPTWASPFGFLRASRELKSTAAEREEAGQQLGRSGVFFGGATRPSPKGLLYVEALEILARPERRLRLSSLVPGEPPALMTLFVKGKRASLCFIDAQGLEVGVAVDLAALGQNLQRRLRAPPVRPGEPPRSMTVAVDHVRWAGFIWGKAGGTGSKPVSSQEALAALTANGVGNAQQALQQLTAARIAVERSGKWVVADVSRRFLAAAWSGHVFEVETLTLPKKDERAALENIEQRAHRLIFVGPAGQCATRLRPRPSPSGKPPAVPTATLRLLTPPELVKALKAVVGA